MKINNSKSTASVSKSSKSGKSSKSSSVSFDSMVDAVSGTLNVEAAASASSVSSVDAVDADSSAFASYVPNDAQGRGTYMLDHLEQLEKDILAGSVTDVVERLKAVLETEAVDMDQIPPRLKEILDEIEMRASVEVAKIEAARPNKKEEG